MKRLLSLCAVVGLGLLASGVFTPASAQQMVPRAQVSGGYQSLWLRSGVDEMFAHGWYADVAGALSRHIAAVFEIGGGYKTNDETIPMPGGTDFKVDLSVHEVMGGVRVSATAAPRVTPFVQVLGGGVRTAENVPAGVLTGSTSYFDNIEGGSATDFGLQAGVGVNVFFNDTIGLRAGGDYIRIFASPSGINTFRLAVGAVVGF